MLINGQVMTSCNQIGEEQKNIEVHCLIIIIIMLIITIILLIVIIIR